MVFCPEHPKPDQNLKFTLLSEMTSIQPLSHGSPPPGTFDLTKKHNPLIKYGHPVNTDTYYGPGHGHPVNTDTYYRAQCSFI